MATKVTVQDIADALSLSRTTVSKVLNHSPAVSDATREAVLEKARELGYHAWNQPMTPAPAEPAEPAEISHFALVMHAIPGGNHMGTVVIPSLEQKLRQEGYSLITCAVSDDDLREQQLPPILLHSQTKALLCLEMFDPEYSRLLCSLGKPVLFIDGYADFDRADIDGDLLLMENRNSVHHMLSTLIQKHRIRTMGFVGDESHCLSFRQRYDAFLLTTFQQGIRTDGFCIQDDDSKFGSIEWMAEQLRHMVQLPDLFFCANDFLAVVLIQALETLGKHVPDDVMVCGFDGMASITWPLNQLTTVVTPVDQLGTYAANILLRKLHHAEPSGSATFLKTSVLFRETAT